MLRDRQWIVDVQGEEIATFELRFLADAVAFMSAYVQKTGNRELEFLAEYDSAPSDYEEDWDYEEEFRE